jgi:transposase
MEQKKMTLEVVYPNAAGIDIGSRSHWVAVGQNAEDVKSFGVYSQDQLEMCRWLKEKQVTHVAMESTGTYWQNLFSTLITHGFEVILVNGKQTKNVMGKKTDIKDCQWIQKLHSLGLLSSSFLPDSTTDIIRTYSRHKLNLINQSASAVKRIQKYFRLMNMRLDVVVKDIVGLTGTRIISSFINGEKDGKVLAKNRHRNCHKSEEEIAKALQYNGREDYCFALKQEWNTYMHLQSQITETDQAISKLLKEIIDKDENKKQYIAPPKPRKRKNKNSMKHTDMNQISYKYFEGVDLMEIDGVSESTIMSLISEVGYEGIKKFKTGKQFVSWLRLAPNNKISGGRVLSHRIPKGSSRLKIALRNCANAIAQLKEGHLVEFFRRINYKKGRATAINALARKLGIIIWNMVTKGVNYTPPDPIILIQNKKAHVIKKIKKQMENLRIKNEELNFVMH